MPPEKVSKSTKTDAYPKKRGFLAAYGATANLRAAARAVGISQKLHFEWLKHDEIYRAAWESVQEEAAQALEDEAVRRAKDGVKRMVFYKGKPIRQGRRMIYVTEYSDQLLLALLKRFRPHLYREHISTEVTGSIDIIQRLQEGRKRVLEMRAKEQSG